MAKLNRSVWRNKGMPNLVIRNLDKPTININNPESVSCQQIHPNGHLAYSYESEPYWEQVSIWVWWSKCWRFIFIDLIRYLDYHNNKRLGLIGREICGWYNKDYNRPYYLIRKIAQYCGRIL